MCSFVYLQVFTPGEHLTATRKRTVERSFAGVHPDVVDQFVLGLEGSAVTFAAGPSTRVVCLVGTTHVLDGDVNNRLLDGTELASA
jgi:hypothetical protein